MKDFITSFSRDEIKDLFREVYTEVNQENKNQILTPDQLTRVYCINQVRKITGMASETIKKLIRSGHLRTTPDGKRITGSMLNEYLKNQSNGKQKM